MSSTGAGRKKIWGIEEISLIDDMYVIDQIVFSWTLSDDEKAKKKKRSIVELMCWNLVELVDLVELHRKTYPKAKKQKNLKT